MILYLDQPRTQVVNWIARYRTTGFPKPAFRLKMGPGYNLEEVCDWYNSQPLHRDRYVEPPRPFGRLLDTELFVGPSELAEILDINANVITEWAGRRTTGCPEPIITLAMGRIWDRDEFLDWWKNWTPQRRSPKLGTLTT